MKIIGHRGARGLAPENTLEGFTKALQHNVDEIEFDVRVTKDHVPVLEHNIVAHDPAGTMLPIRFTTYAELKRHKPDLATLAEALVLLDGKTDMNIEIKGGEPLDPIVAVLEAHFPAGADVSHVWLGSKSQRTLRELHRRLPHFGIIIIERWSGIRATYRARQLGTKRLSMNHVWLWSGFLKAMQRRGYQVSAYTINKPERAQKWSKCLHGVITDYPDRFKK